MATKHNAYPGGVGGIESTEVKPGHEPSPKSVPIRVVLTGADDPAGNYITPSGVQAYLVYVYKQYSYTDTSVDRGSVWATTGTLSGVWGINSAYKEEMQNSGTLEGPYEIAVRARPYWPNTGAVQNMWSGQIAVTGLITPMPPYTYSPNYAYPWDYRNWNYRHFHYFFVGARDNAGNQTDFGDFRCWSHYFYGNSGVTDMTALADTIAPTGMYFFPVV